jgi:hypothetical protein
MTEKDLDDTHVRPCRTTFLPARDLRWVANVWRSVCTVTGLLKPAAAQAGRQAACKTLGISGRSSSRPGNTIASAE